MQPDDIAALEALLREIVQSQTPAIRHAERALEILSARRHRRNGAGAHDGLLAALIDESRFTVHCNGATCDLGATVLFRLFRRLVDSAGRFLSIEDLVEDVWGGDHRTGSAVRSAVWKLRSRLREAGMADLAGAIWAQRQHHGLFLEEIATPARLDRDWTANGRPVDSPPGTRTTDGGEPGAAVRRVCVRSACEWGNAPPITDAPRGSSHGVALNDAGVALEARAHPPPMPRTGGLG